jgi:hypothetical protein
MQARAKAEHIDIQAGSGSVFEDLGLPDARRTPGEGGAPTRGIRRIVKDENWTQPSCGGRTRDCWARCLGLDATKAGTALAKSVLTAF